MAPVAESKVTKQVTKTNGIKASFNPFYSPLVAVDTSDGYEYNKYRVRRSVDDVELHIDIFQADVP